MLHHLSLPVTDLEAASRLYDAMLSELGYSRVASAPGFAGYGVEQGKDQFALKYDESARSAGPRFHLAFGAMTRAAVDNFYKAAIEHGAQDNGPPGLREHYGPNYYAAFIIDLDGHHIEAVINE